MACAPTYLGCSYHYSVTYITKINLIQILYIEYFQSTFITYPPEIRTYLISSIFKTSGALYKIILHTAKFSDNGNEEWH